MKTHLFERVALAALICAACVGPPAPDGAICRDLIHRVCITPRCSSTSVLNVTTACDQELQQRTSCDQDGFEFTTPSRDRILECRLPLLHAGNNIETHPDCLDVDQMVAECPDVTRFLQGVK